MHATVKLKKAELAYLTSYKKGRGISLREYNRINILLLLHRGKKVREMRIFLA